MHPAYSMNHVERSVEACLGVHTKMVSKRVPIAEMSFMVNGQPPRTRYRTERVEEKFEQWSKMIGVLACKPTSRVGKDEVVPHLDYFHHRSSVFVDFFCMGYMRPLDYGDYNEEVVTTVNGKPWVFNSVAFEGCRRDLASHTEWTYSGETDLVLAVARKAPGGHAWIDYSSAISCNLEEMLRDGAITSVRSFFEQIFAAGEEYTGSDPIWALSDKLGLKVGGNFIVETVLGLLPESVKKSYKAAKHFAIRDVSRAP
jgi:hypothetical protein